jgi:hypothetical protein
MDPLNLFKNAEDGVVFGSDRYNLDQKAIEDAINKLTQSTAAGDSGADHIKTSGVAGLNSPNNTLQAILAALKQLDDDNKAYVLGQIGGVVLGQIPDGTITEAKLNSSFIGTVALPTTDKTIKGSIAELFTSASNGKELVRTAVTGKGVTVQANPTYQQLSDGISSIVVGDYKIGDLIFYDAVGVKPYSISFGFTSITTGYSIAVDEKNNCLYVGKDNAGSYRLVKYAPIDNPVQVWDKSLLISSTSYLPAALAIDSVGNIWVGCNGGKVIKFDPSGNILVQPAATLFANDIKDLVIDNDDNIYVTAISSTAVQKLSGTNAASLWSYNGTSSTGYGLSYSPKRNSIFFSRNIGVDEIGIDGTKKNSLAWATNANAGYASVCDADDTLYCNSTTSVVAKVDLKTFTQAWTYNASIIQPQIVADPFGKGVYVCVYDSAAPLYRHRHIFQDGTPSWVSDILTNSNAPYKMTFCKSLGRVMYGQANTTCAQYRVHFKITK